MKVDVLLFGNFLRSYIQKMKLNTTPTMGLEFLNEYLLHNGLKSKILYFDYIKKSWFKDYEPKVVGIQGKTNYISEVKHWAKYIKNLYKNVKVIVGGPICLSHEELLKSRYIDAVCHGEGEITLLDYASRVVNGESTKDLPGIYQRGAEFIPRTEQVNLNDLILPDYKNIYLRGIGNIITTRGCNGKCSFCQMKEMYKNVKVMSAEKSIKWMDNIRQHQDIKQFVFNDDNLLVSPKNARKIFKYLEANEIKAVFLSRADSIIKNESLIKEYSDIITSIEIGIESFSKTQLDRWYKGITVEQNNKALQILRDLEICNTSFIILNDGQTTIEELEEQINGMKNAPTVMVREMELPFIVSNNKLNTMINIDNKYEINGIDHFERPHKFLESTSVNMTIIKESLLGGRPDGPKIKKVTELVNNYAKNRLDIYLEGVKIIKNCEEKDIKEWEEDAEKFKDQLNNYVNLWIAKYPEGMKKILHYLTPMTVSQFINKRFKELSTSSCSSTATST